MGTLTIACQCHFLCALSGAIEVINAKRKEYKEEIHEVFRTVQHTLIHSKKNQC